MSIIDPAEAPTTILTGFSGTNLRQQGVCAYERADTLYTSAESNVLNRNSRREIDIVDLFASDFSVADVAKEPFVLRYLLTLEFCQYWTVRLVRQSADFSLPPEQDIF